jgi:arylsulfatase A-like enzyme
MAFECLVPLLLPTSFSNTRLFTYSYTPMKNRVLLIIAYALGLLPFIESAAKSPNILFIFTDDQSSRTVSSYPEAYDWAHTPNIDRLAASGIRFEQAYTSAWCMPARATMLTGLQQHNVPSLHMIGPYPGATYDPKELHFWPQVFRKNGYTTGHIGKWHTGTDTGYGRDWDYQYVWIRPTPTPGNAREYYVDQMIIDNGKKIGPVDAYATDNYTDKAIDFIKGETRDNDKPWYLWLCYTGIHGPFTPADRHLNDYEDVEIPVPADIYPPRAGKPEYSGQYGMWKADSKGDARLYDNGKFGDSLYDATRQYHQAARSLDEGIGRLIETLKATNQLENTLVVYTADQGFAWGQHGFKHKLAPYASNTKVPFIVSMPGQIPSNKVCKSPITSIDLVPTFFKYAGMKLPWKMDGRDMSSLLKNPDQAWDRPAFLTYTNQSYKPDTATIPPPPVYTGNNVPWYAWVIQDRYKFIQTLVENEIPELYHIDNDPDELHNLALLPEYRDTVKKHHQLLVSELKRTNAQFVDSLPSMKGF